MKKLLILLSTISLCSLISCSKIDIPEEGVSLRLAEQRKMTIADVVYNLHFNIPESRDSSIVGSVELSFTLSKLTEIILDLRADANSIIGLKMEGKNIDYKFINGHIIIPKWFAKRGQNSISIQFVAGNSSLNRSNDFLYTLLVPDRASTIFPCFDQPDSKAVYNLTLDLPAKWTAVSNGAAKNKQLLDNGSLRISFEPTLPISSYLFAFCAGDFQQVTRTIGQYSFTMFHRETDAVKFERNVGIIFQSHADALAWLENYTGIDYPFGKLDFVLIPGFQYSGMEHPGAIFYRDSRLLLDENPSETQRLQQANLIAHEVAHQWFGNLVTMRWFNDVWLKEVFAGFMADQIVNPQYPDINHNLGFILSHFPRAYSVDRTQGANPIVQDLDNLLFAGTIYGDIIYHKAPIMMQQLVMVMGEDAFQQGVREYLRTFNLGNACWDELVGILDKYSDSDLRGWAAEWTHKPGRPIIKCSVIQANNNLLFEPKGPIPVPPMQVQISDFEGVQHLNVSLIGSQLPKTIQLPFSSESRMISLNSLGWAYGCFVPDSLNLISFLSKPDAVKNSVSRASAYISLHEMFLDGLIKKDIYLYFLTDALMCETEPQIQNFLLNSLQTVWWRFTPSKQREEFAETIESKLWEVIGSNVPVDQKRNFLSTLFSIFITDKSAEKLGSGWHRGEVFGIKLNENELTNLSYELMLRLPGEYSKIVEIQRLRITNTDRLKRFDFVVPALSPDTSLRIALFDKLKLAENRRPEPTALEALRFLNHPLRSDFSLRLIKTSLDLLPEIQRTGDIFFPKGWLDALFSGHSSPEAKSIVLQWIDNHPDLSPNLKAKLLQSSHLLMRVD